MKQLLSLRTVWAVAALVGLLAFALPAFAGGWAVVTLDHLPDQVIAGQPVNVGFVVRQHGITPLGGLKPVIRLQKAGEANSKAVPVASDGNTGHYSATLTFPSAGVWQWTVETGFWPEGQPMPDLSVVAEGDPASTESSGGAASSASLPVVFGVVGLVGAAGGLFALARTRAPWAAVMLLVAILVGGVGFASAATRTTASGSPVVVSSLSQVEMGQRLFVAKGCVVCHTHDAVQEVRKHMGFSEGDGPGPNLTNFSASSDYLAKWLDDPKTIKLGTEMPTLGLSDEEIGALAAFINAP